MTKDSPWQVGYLGSAEGCEAAAQELAGFATVIHVDASADAVAAALPQLDALLDASMRVPLTDALLEHAQRLRIISCATTGADHIARTALSMRDVPVRTLKEDGELLQNLTPAAELSWALVMACARRLVPATRDVREGKWVREGFPGVMLKGKQLGVIGCGRIGGWMARYATAFGMRTVGFDPFVMTWPADIERAPSLDALVETSDVVSIHVHLADATRNLMSAALFAKIKPGAIFINTSRGAIADEAALLAGLESGRVGAAGLDVLEGEPNIEAHPLVGYARRHDNLLITPHCGGFSHDAVRIVCRRAAQKVRAQLGGRA